MTHQGLSRGARTGMSRRREPIKRLVLAAGLILALGACSSLNPFAKETVRYYDLRPSTAIDTNIPETPAQLVVEEPVASRVLNTDRIAVRSSAYEVGYYQGVRWSDRATRMVQAKLLEAFENSGKIIKVGRQAVGLGGNYALKSELREFQVERQDGRAPDVVMALNVKLVEQPSSLIIAAQTFDQRVRAPGAVFESMVGSFNEVMTAIQGRIIGWTIRTIEEHRKASAARMQRMELMPQSGVDEMGAAQTISGVPLAQWSSAGPGAEEPDAEGVDGEMPGDL